MIVYPNGDITKPIEKPRFQISDLCSYLENYLEPEQIREVYRAYVFGAEAHEGQKRRSGEAYIYHPLAVAKHLAEMRMDCNSIIAAILHDVIEDTVYVKADIVCKFGEEVAELVDGVSKLTTLNSKTQAEAQAQNLRKMFLAMTRDIRVIVIKLADRLHNMRTLGSMPPEKCRRIAKETIEIYAPIANRLGMNNIRHELEDLGFYYLYPLRYQVIQLEIQAARGKRKEILNTIEAAVVKRLDEENIPAKVIGREKHLYSIFRKMKTKRLSLKEILDVYAFRVIVDKVDTCYRVLGSMHSLFRPVPGKFKDYIAIPKANGYQSLHTILMGPHAVHVEIQIRSEDMHRVAEAGIAAHWLYKVTGEVSNKQAFAHEWLRDILAVQEGSGSPLEFIENVKIDLFPDEVYVFTPKGEIMVLAKGSTVIDFAYSVHTDVGNSCVACRIDRRLVPLQTLLLNGQTIEIITAPGARPNPAWLNFVVTAKARTHIRNYLKSFKTQEAKSLGERLLEKALALYSSSIEEIPNDVIKAVLKEVNMDTFDELLEEMGLGNRMAPLVARRLIPDDVETDENVNHKNRFSLAVKGTEGMVIHLAKCCRPIPGDPIMGFFSSGKGIVIHHNSCKNTATFRKRPENWIEVQWSGKDSGDYPTEIYIVVNNQRGVLATVASTLSGMDSNIENLIVEDHDGLTSTLTFTILVKNRLHLAKLIKRVRKINTVLKISRRKGGN